ncbi:MAG: hypothetical protein LQ340_008071, partial [Diploschistes diacapsis]
HDAVLDYYGRRLATCSSDKTIKIFDVDPSAATHRLAETLRGHDGAVWSVAWAHPKFGSVLASASYDGRVLIWRSSANNNAGASNNHHPPSHQHASQNQNQNQGQSPGSFQKVFESTLHTASVNSLSWAPHECGCVLACASSDGSISVLEFEDGRWEHVLLQGAHALGVNAVSWAPAARPGSLVSAGGAQQGHGQGQGHAGRRFVSGGSDCLVKIWEWRYVFSISLLLRGW